MNVPCKYVYVFEQSIAAYDEGGQKFIYNTLNFIQLKKDYQPVYCFQLDAETKNIINSIYFLCRDKKAISIPESPFGGFNIRATKGYHLDEFVFKIIDHLKAKQIDEIIIKSPTNFYLSEVEQTSIQGLLNLGFCIDEEAINHHIVVTDANFDEIIHEMQKRKIKKAKTFNLNFREYKLSEISTVYAFINKCRIQKGVSINISLPQLLNAFKAIPESYKAFVVEMEDNIIAATIAVKVNDQVIYNYLPASDQAYNFLSPMVFLLNGLYAFCQSNNFKVIDLGISTLNNHPQDSLIKFKERMGGIMSKKLTYTLNLKGPNSI